MRVMHGCVTQLAESWADIRRCRAELQQNTAGESLVRVQPHPHITLNGSEPQIAGDADQPATAGKPKRFTVERFVLLGEKNADVQRTARNIQLRHH